MIAAKMLDPVMGIDIHIIQPPGPVPPLPIPHPFIGMVVDPMDLAPIIGATVMVNSMPRATAGTGCKNIPPHIPIGGTFVKPPGNEGEIFMGSATVLADGAPLSFLALPVLSCSDVGMPPPPRAKKKGGAKSLALPTTVLMAIPAGPPVLVGGPPTIDMMAMAMKLGMAGLGKAFKKLKKTKAMKKLSDKLHDAAEGAMKKVGIPKNIRNKVHKGICSVTGHPVDIASGKVFTDHIDFELPGPIPLVWERTWFSTSTYNGPLGYGWHHSYDMALALDTPNQVLAIRMADGRSVPFPILEVGEEAFNRQEKLTLYRDKEGYFMRDADRLYYRFKPISLLKSDMQLLTRIENKSGFNIQFSYNPSGHLTQIIDSAGRMLTVSCDTSGKILSIHAPHPDREGESFPIVSYAYNGADDLIRVTDPLNHSFHFEYDHHLLIRETNRNGLSFYFEYDGHDEFARCVRTWGDGGIYDHKLTYAGGVTVVENSLGHRSSHFHDTAVVLREIDPLGNETRFAYNEFYEKVAETDALGQTTFFEYDQRGNLSKISYPDGSAVEMSFDDDLLTSAVDQVGGNWGWEYDEEDLLVNRTDSMGSITQFEYNAGLLKLIKDANGGQASLEFDEDFNIKKLTTADGVSGEWRYDKLGRNRVSINRKKSVLRKIFDLNGRIIRQDKSDGNRRYLSYDSEGYVVHVKDKNNEVHFTYQGMGQLSSREENAIRVEFVYDTEEQLIGIKNEHGFLYGFSRNANGKVELESRFDEVQRFYKRDSLNRISSILRASGFETKYKYDPLGRFIEVNHSNGEQEKYGYRPDGRLILAENRHIKLRFERDLLGNVTREWEGDHWVESIYNQMGLRIEMLSSLGANFEFNRNHMGDVQIISGLGNHSDWQTQFKHDELGLNIEKVYSNGVRTKWKRDNLGRPTEHQIVGGKKYNRTRKYVWESSDRLRQLMDTAYGDAWFEHDNFGNLSAAQYGDGKTEYRVPDAVGNIFQKKDRSDRIYGPAGQLLESEGTRFEYDSEGNLIRKTTINGEIWQYDWNAAGMLVRIIRPDNKIVSFSYDALGRRLSKHFQGKTTRWLWDGNVPLHEWVEFEENDQGSNLIRIKSKNSINIRRKKEQITDLHQGLSSNSPNFENLITWVFEADSFSPLAKFQHNKQYAIVTDHLGTPISMHDESGKAVWGAEISIHGELRRSEGKRDDCPFRWPGQYEDIETGLYYNRFRYYSPESGTYISQDPIGLRGGNPNIYAYTNDVNLLTDVFGLAHGLSADVIRGGDTVFSDTYSSGGVPGGGRLNQQEALLTHTERKFLNDIDDVVEPGDHLKMVGELNPCKPGCQPAIRDFVLENNVTAEYKATSTGNVYKWEKLDDKHVLQTEIIDGKTTKYKYNMETRRRVKVCQ